MHLEVKAPDEASRVVIMPNLHALTKSDRSSTFSLMDVSSLLVALYGSAGLEPVSVFEKDILEVVFVKVLVWKVLVLSRGIVSRENGLFVLCMVEVVRRNVRRVMQRFMVGSRFELMMDVLTFDC